MPGMSDAKARLLAKLEADPRSDEWIYVSIDETDDDSVCNASGIYPDEHSAFLAAEEERRTNSEHGITGWRYIPIPMFRAKGQHAH